MGAMILAAVLAVIISVGYHKSRIPAKRQRYEFSRKGNFYSQRGGKPTCPHDNSDYDRNRYYQHWCLDCGAEVLITRHAYLRD